MNNRTHTVLHMSLGTILLVSGLVAVLGGAIIVAGLFGTPTQEDPAPRRTLFPRIGNVQPTAPLGNAAAAEATYGPVNKSALNQTKEGLISRIANNVRSRRAARQGTACPCPQQHQAQSLQVVRVVSQPVYRVPKPLPPLDDCPDCGFGAGDQCSQSGLDVKPSRDRASTQKLRSDLLESTFGPVNKSALSETKSASPTELDPADEKPSLPADFPEESPVLKDAIPAPDVVNTEAVVEGLPPLPPLPEPEQSDVQWVPVKVPCGTVGPAESPYEMPPLRRLPIKPSLDLRESELEIRPSR